MPQVNENSWSFFLLNYLSTFFALLIIVHSMGSTYRSNMALKPFSVLNFNFILN